MLRKLSTVCAQVVGLDSGDSGSNEARKICPAGKFYALGVYNFSSNVEETEFDLAISTEVVEHLFYPRKLVKLAYAKLIKGGVLMVSTP